MIPAEISIDGSTINTEEISGMIDMNCQCYDRAIAGILNDLSHQYPNEKFIVTIERQRQLHQIQRYLHDNSLSLSSLDSSDDLRNKICKYRIDPSYKIIFIDMTIHRDIDLGDKYGSSPRHLIITNYISRMELMQICGIIKGLARISYMNFTELL